MMHPLVRDLYKRVLLVGRDYPQGIDHVRKTWKKALQDPSNAPSCVLYPKSSRCDREIRAAVAKGRHFVREMIGIVQLKKYRAMKRRYYTTDPQHKHDPELQERIQNLEERHH